MLSFKEQNCNITLREGIEEYNSYLVANRKEILTELSHSSIVMDHDATHVIFGLDTTLEEESLLDSWVLWCSSFELKYLMSYSKQPEIKDLYKKLLREVGDFKFIHFFLLPLIYLTFKSLKNEKKRKMDLQHLKILKK